MSLLLDTCAILWLAGSADRLSSKAQQRVVDPGQTVFVSAISGGELACLSAKGRIALPEHWRRWFRQAIDENGWKVLPIELEVIEEAYSLPDQFHADPADRILVATARLNRFTLLTTDQRILDYPHVRSLS